MFRDVPVDLLVSAGRVPQSHRSFHDALLSCVHPSNDASDKRPGCRESPGYYRWAAATLLGVPTPVGSPWWMLWSRPAWIGGCGRSGWRKPGRTPPRRAEVGMCGSTIGRPSRRPWCLPVTRCAPGWVTRRGSSRWHGWSRSGSVRPMQWPATSIERPRRLRLPPFRSRPVIAVPGGRLNGTVGFWTGGSQARGDPSPAAEENMHGLNMQSSPYCETRCRATYLPDG